MEQTVTPYAPPSDDSPTKGPHKDWEAVARIRDLFYRARHHRRSLLEKWTANYEILHNQVWAPNRPSWMPAPRVAEIFPTVSSIVAWETDASPTFDVTPFADPNSPYHQELQKRAADLKVALRAAWMVNDYDAEIQKVVWDGNVYGTGITKSIWDAHRHGGLGDATLRRVDPFFFYPDPDATSLDDARYLIETYELSEEELEERFPGALGKVGGGTTEDIDRSPTLTGSPRGSAPKANPAPIAPATSSSFSRPGAVHSYGKDVESNRHTVIECWRRCTCGESEHDLAVKQAKERERLAASGNVSTETLDMIEQLGGSLNEGLEPDGPTPPEQPPMDPMMGAGGEAPPMDPAAMDPAQMDPMMGGGEPAPDPQAVTPESLEAAFAGEQEAPAEPTPADIDFTPTSHWHVTVVCADVVLMDAPVDRIWSHGQHPYDRFVAVDTGEFWGQSLVELLAPVQQSINRLLAAIEHNIWLAGNPVFVEDNRSGLQRTRITNKPGQRITKNAGGEADWMNPPQIHPQLAMQLVQFYVDQIERISGLSAIVRGATPTGRNAQGVLDSVQEAAFVRIRMALRNLESMLRNAGEKNAALIAEFYDAARVVAIVGPDGQETATALEENHFYLPDPSSGEPHPMRFKLSVHAGSTLATARSSRIAEADTLFAMGAIDEEAVLIAHDFPNWPNVAARVREMKAAMGEGPQPDARQAAGRLE